MKDAHREKLRQLPRERKMYLLQQNQHIKENRPVDSSLRKSIPISNSGSSLFAPKALRQKAVKKNEISTQSVFPPKGPTRSIQIGNSASSLMSTGNTDNLMVVTNELPLPAFSHESKSGRLGPQKDHSSVNDNKKQDNRRSKDGDEASYTLENHQSSEETDIRGLTTMSNNNVKNQCVISPSTSSSIDQRAATYKYSRKNRSKVGSMILEFDALATRLEETTFDESAAWLLFDNKTFTRQCFMNNTRQSNSVRQHPSLANLFPTVSTSTDSTTENATSENTASENTASDFLLSDSYAYASLTRKSGIYSSRLVSGSLAVDDNVMRGRDRNSAYYYVERLRNR